MKNFEEDEDLDEYNEMGGDFFSEEDRERVSEFLARQINLTYKHEFEKNNILTLKNPSTFVDIDSYKIDLTPPRLENDFYEKEKEDGKNN